MTVNNIFSLFAWLIRIILGSKEKFEYLLIHHQGQVCILMYCALKFSHERIKMRKVMLRPPAKYLRESITILRPIDM